MRCIGQGIQNKKKKLIYIPRGAINNQVTDERAYRLEKVSEQNNTWSNQRT